MTTLTKRPLRPSRKRLQTLQASTSLPGASRAKPTVEPLLDGSLVPLVRVGPHTTMALGCDGKVVEHPNGWCRIYDSKGKIITVIPVNEYRDGTSRYKGRSPFRLNPRQ